MAPGGRSAGFMFPRLTRAQIARIRSAGGTLLAAVSSLSAALSRDLRPAYPTQLLSLVASLITSAWARLLRQRRQVA